MPTVWLQGQRVERPITETHVVDGRTVHMRELHEELQLTYVHEILTEAEIASLLRLADGRGGFVRSPVKTQGEGADRAADVRRNSTSCPLLWPLVYGTEEMRAKLRAQPAFIEERRVALERFAQQCLRDGGALSLLCLELATRTSITGTTYETTPLPVYLKWLSEQPALPAELHEQLSERYGHALEDALEEPPEVGELDIQVVKDSTYFFS